MNVIREGDSTNVVKKLRLFSSQLVWGLTTLYHFSPFLMLFFFLAIGDRDADAPIYFFVFILLENLFLLNVDKSLKQD